MRFREANVISLQDYPGGVAQGIRSTLYKGRNEIVTTGPNAEFGFIGSDPYNTNAYTGLVVPSTPSDAIGDARYLFLLARESFSAGEQSVDNLGVRLVGIRQYAELIARIPAGTLPLAPIAPGIGPPEGSTVTFRKEITSPLWHPIDGDISWHVVVINKVARDTRNPANTDGFIYQDALSPALLYQVGAPSGAGYVPPNGGRPWGVPLGASLGNMHDLRYCWRTEQSEHVLDIPIPVPCDVALFASVRQNNPALNPTFGPDQCCLLPTLSPEDQFVVAFNAFAQYGSIAGGLVFDQNLDGCVP
jgi:hypothetical protein